MKTMYSMKSLLFLLLSFFVITQSGCKKKTSTTTPCDTPVGYFTYSESTTTSGEINFSSTVYPACTFKWDFGDGTTSTDANPSHTYTSVGTTYMVNMTFTNSCGASLSYSKSVTPTNVTGRIAFYHYAPGFFNDVTQYISVTVTGPFSTNVFGKITQSQFMPDCSDPGVLVFTLQPGTYNWSAFKTIFNKTESGTVTVVAGDCLLHELTFP